MKAVKDSPFRCAATCVEPAVDFWFRCAFQESWGLVNLLESHDRAQFPSWREIMQNSVQIWASKLDPAKLPVRPLGEEREIWAWVGDYDRFLGYMAWMVKALENGPIGYGPL